MRLLDYRNFPRSGEWTDDVATCMTPTVQSGGEGGGERATRSIEQALLEQPTILLSAFPMVDKRQWDAKPRDWWLWLVGLVASVVSVGATWYYYQAHEILLYGDSHSHLNIARRLFDSSNPGDITQLGAVWLPLPHILMWPFIWNDFLWHSGIAGSIVSMGCYIITACYIYKMAYRLTMSERASFIGTLVFVLNPNVLYIQATPLSEMVCAVTFIAACYHFLCWAQTGQTRQIVYASIAMFFATLARYDNWALFAVLMCLLPIIGLEKRYPRSEIFGIVTLYSILAGFGITLWLLWGQVIFGHLLYFSSGPYSSAKQQRIFLQLGTLYTYHNLFLSLKYYGADVLGVLGPLVAIAALLGLISSIRKRFLSPEGLLVLALLTPFVFYVVSLYTGQAILYVPGVVPKNAEWQFFNVRYGIAMVAPCSVFIALLLEREVIHEKQLKTLATLFQISLLFLILVQSWTISTSNITLEDGQKGISCEVPLAANTYLAQYYNGGKVLETNYASRVDGGDADFDFKDVIYEGSGDLWKNALHNPGAYVTWVVAAPSNPADIVSQQIGIHTQVFLSQFTLVASDKSNVLLYHRNSDPLVKVHTIPNDFLSQYALCPPH